MPVLNDIKLTYKNKKGLMFLMLFRASSFFATGNILLKIIGLPVRLLYLFFVQWLLGIDIPDTTCIGTGFNVWHGHGLVINPLTKIGTNVSMCHNTTVGHKSAEEGLCPTIGNNVKIAPHCIIIGDITIGDNCVIGIATLVNKSIPAGHLAYGNPMIVKKIN